MSWWNTSYLFRRRLSLTTIEALPVGHPIRVPINKTLLTMGKVRPDFRDIVIARADGDFWTPLPTSRDARTATFNLPYSIPQNITVANEYYMYYGNLDLINAVDLGEPRTNEWPFKIPFYSSRLTYTNPGIDWLDGVTDTRDARATFQFSGSKVRLLANCGFGHGKIGVQIDNNPISTADLYRPHHDDVEVVFEFDNLDEATYTLRVYSLGTQNAAATSSSVNIYEIDYVGYVQVADLGEDITELDWAVHTGGSS